MSMAPLVRFDGVSLSFGDQPILNEASFMIEAGERVCLIGRNGAGKSTTLKLIAGIAEPDSGTIERPSSVRFALLDQKLADGSELTVREFVALGMAAQIERIESFQRLSTENSGDKAALRRLEALQREIDAGGGWSVDIQIDSLITELGLPAAKRMDELSGGWRRRVALARALVAHPDLLLLDEPTNHLDISTIVWLENEVKRFPGAVLFVTHDRSFVEHVATRIVDLDRGELRSWSGGYLDYLDKKLLSEQEEDRHNAEFDKKLAAEEVWVRKGVKARTTRNEGRVRALEELRKTRSERIARPRAARILMNESDDVSGRKVIEAHNVSHGYNGRMLLDGFSLRVMRGDRLGIVGNNGVGKSTLLRILLGELVPDSGTVKLGTNIVVAYFDQLRRDLDPDKTVAEVIGEGREFITIDGRKKHVVSYLTDFLFSAKRARTPIAALSGGERNRVLLAMRGRRPTNLLVLDEPTNDLDVETLEALEARLAGYDGTLIVVSHDRHFLDAAVTSTLVFEASGQVVKHAGGYSDWAARGGVLAVAEGPEPEALATPSGAEIGARATASGAEIDARATANGTEIDAGATANRAEAAQRTPPKQRKLSYKLQRELDALPDEIERLEQALVSLERTVAETDFYRRPQQEVQAELARVAAARQTLERAVERWGELEQQAAGLAADS